MVKDARWCLQDCRFKSINCQLYAPDQVTPGGVTLDKSICHLTSSCNLNNDTINYFYLFIFVIVYSSGNRESLVFLSSSLLVCLSSCLLSSR